MKKYIFILILTCLFAYTLSQTSEPKSELEEKCKLEAEPGNGTDESIRFFFDETTQKCQNFTFTGDGGNENNFETELDCLNDCFVGVESSEGTTQHEEDIVFVEKDQPILEWECDKPKEAGSGHDSIQKFYYNSKWKTCFAFKYSGEGGNGNRFSTRSECESNCAVADGSVCTGPSGTKELLKIGGNCDEAECSEGHKCANGLRGPECCVKDELDAIEAGFSDTCPDGSKAEGIFEDYFQATFAENCDDLICNDGQSCVQVNKHFAKCCGGEKRLADEIPVSAGALHVQIDGEEDENIMPSRLFFF
jgi:hypothetical protein